MHFRQSHWKKLVRGAIIFFRGIPPFKGDMPYVINNNGTAFTFIFVIMFIYSPAGTLNKCSNFEESMKLCRNVEYDHLSYFSYSAIRNLIRHAIYFELKNVILKTLIRMAL